MLSGRTIMMLGKEEERGEKDTIHVCPGTRKCVLTELKCEVTFIQVIIHGTKYWDCY